jgi:hypothetical protein
MERPARVKELLNERSEPERDIQKDT